MVAWKYHNATLPPLFCNARFANQQLCWCSLGFQRSFTAILLMAQFTHSNFLNMRRLFKLLIFSLRKRKDQAVLWRAANMHLHPDCLLLTTMQNAANMLHHTQKVLDCPHLILSLVHLLPEHRLFRLLLASYLTKAKQMPHKQGLPTSGLLVIKYGAFHSLVHSCTNLF